MGACFTVNNMLRAECYKQRMEKGLSFLEFNYMIMQAYDFYHMFQHRAAATCSSAATTSGATCWAGTELIRRKLGKDAHAMTITLLLNTEGKKMGKTASRRRVAGPQQDLSRTTSTSTGATSATRTCSSASAC